GALAGLLGVLGVAVYNALTLIHRFQHLERREGEPFGVDLVLRGASERLSPMLLATLATGATVLPALLLGDVPGLEVVRPMAIVVGVGGGLLTPAVRDVVLRRVMSVGGGSGPAKETDRLLKPHPGHGFGVVAAPGGGAGKCR